MRILITNVYSYQNKGDAAIVLALIQEIKRVFNKPKITVQTADTTNDADKYNTDITESLLWLLLSKQRKKSFINRSYIATTGILSICIYILVYRLLGLKLKLLLNKNIKKFIKHNESADIVIGCGGGYLRTGSSSPKDSMLLMITCMNFLVAKWIHKPVYLYSQSIGPVHGKLQNFTLKWALNQVDIIEVREKISLDIVKKLNINSRVELTADAAFLLKSALKSKNHVSDNMQIGVTVRRWFHDDTRNDIYIKTVANTIDYLVERYDAVVTSLPQVIASKFDDDDRVSANLVMAQVIHKEDFILIDEEMSPEKLISYCSRFHVFMGTRMHSNIFALLNAVPVVAIGYEHKTEGIMADFGIRSLVVDIDKATPKRLINKLDNVITNREEYHYKIQAHLSDYRKNAQQAINIIKEDYFEKTA